MRVNEFIIEGYKEALLAFAKDVDQNEVQNTISVFKDLVNRNQIQGNEKNIDWWIKQGFNNFKLFVDNKSSEASKTQMKRKKLPGESIVLRDDNDWFIVAPLNKESSCFHGKDTHWCVTKPNQTEFEDYFYNKNVLLIYCYNKHSAKWWAIVGHEDIGYSEIFDQNDVPIGLKAFKNQTGLDPQVITMQLINQHKGKISQTKNKYITSVDEVRETLDKLQHDKLTGIKVERMPKLEKQIEYLGNDINARNYISYIGRQHIDQLSEKLKMIILASEPELIRYIDTPSISLQRTAIMSMPTSIQYIKNPALKIQLMVVNDDTSNIGFIHDPLPEVQIQAVTQTPESIYKIQNPIPAVQLMVLKAGVDWHNIHNPSKEAFELLKTIDKERYDNLRHDYEYRIKSELAYVNERQDIITELKNKIRIYKNNIKKYKKDKELIDKHPTIIRDVIEILTKEIEKIRKMQNDPSMKEALENIEKYKTLLGEK